MHPCDTELDQSELLRPSGCAREGTDGPPDHNKSEHFKNWAARIAKRSAKLRFKLVQMLKKAAGMETLGIPTMAVAFFRPSFFLSLPVCF